MATIQERLAAIQKNLAAIVSVEKHETMTPVRFLSYAIEQIGKAATDKPSVAASRLKSLHNAISIAKDNYIDDASESIKVPIFVDEQTTLKEQSNTLSTPDKSAGMNPSGQSTFEDGFVAKMDSLKKALALLSKVDDDDEDEAAKAKKAGAGEDPDEGEQKAKKASEDIAEDDDSIKRKKGEADAGGDGGAMEDEQGKKKAAKKVEKGATSLNATDAEGWPLDMNAKSVQKGAADNDWGSDS